jgi:hypothetical protein
LSYTECFRIKSRPSANASRNDSGRDTTSIPSGGGEPCGGLEQR